MSSISSQKSTDLQTQLLSMQVQKKQRDVDFEQAIQASWEVIAPFWPLKSLIAVNPIKGFEQKPFEHALVGASTFFEQDSLPKQIEDVNRETIKWLQVFFDEGQATLKMPFRSEGLYKAWLKLILYDRRIHKGNKQKKQWIKSLPLSPKLAIKYCLEYLDVAVKDVQLFLTLSLTTLPGWAAHIKYRIEQQTTQQGDLCPVQQEDYLAMRLILICLLCPSAHLILDWHKSIPNQQSKIADRMKLIEEAETNYLYDLLQKLPPKTIEKKHSSEAQLIFCIDVRSEPIRRAIEKEGSYSTFGYAGFFGIPVQIENSLTQDSHASCPVLLKPQHLIDESQTDSEESFQKKVKGHQKLMTFKRIYQSLKYNFSTPFALVESMGLATGIWMGVKTLNPKLAFRLKKAAQEKIIPNVASELDLGTISFEDQCAYAKNALQMIGLTSDFASLVVFCGHGSQTENNAYGSMLDCGACGGRHGGTNAKILVKILNDLKVRLHLAEEKIYIPPSTLFIAGVHNTTTDEIELFLPKLIDPLTKHKIKNLQRDLEAAKISASKKRTLKMDPAMDSSQAADHTALTSTDWAQTRPEWGLARNASFIVAPRNLTQDIDLDGRAFLHSYDPEADIDGKILRAILTAPMVVAQWINSQYMFSSLDNVAYGSGSKVTKNITGKIGVMQGNASDLMHGLPLQSLFSDDHTPYHQAIRLQSVIYAPRNRIFKIIETEELLLNLVKNEWVHLICIEPETRDAYILESSLNWIKSNH